MNHYYDTFRTALGEFSVTVNEAGAVTATAFGNRAALESRFGNHPCHLIGDKTLVRAAREQIVAYLAGERCDFTVPLAPQGTSFQQKIWAALRAIPFGETRTYRQLAVQIGRPAAARAVGGANGANPICVIVPCHRVIGADGSLTGFAFGEDLKRRLLELERVPAFRAA